MIQIHPELLSELYGKDLILFGTGRHGKIVALYLEEDPDIRLLGVTNSRVTGEDCGTFLGTQLPIRSIQTWAKTAPHAAILIAAAMTTAQTPIENLCRSLGFQTIIPLTPELMNAIAYAQINACALPQETFLDVCKQGASFTANPLLELMCFANELRDTHQATFSEFQGIYKGQTVAVAGAGPTLNFYSQLDGIPHIGVNSAFKRENLKLDYYFWADSTSHPEWGRELINYSFIKFLGQYSCEGLRNSTQISESIIEENGGRKYFFYEDQTVIHTDITHYPLMGFRSIIFSAIHFALYTSPKRILLVGCDCSDTGHFNGDPSAAGGASKLTGSYRKVKQFVERYYPNTEIVSVNPVGLKGLFRDVYTKNYIDAHPEMDWSECEILDRGEDQNG